MTTGSSTTGAKKHFEQQNKTYGFRILKGRLQPHEIKKAHIAVHFPSQ